MSNNQIYLYEILKDICIPDMFNARIKLKFMAKILHNKMNFFNLNKY